MLYHGLIHRKINRLMHFLCYDVSVEKATRVKAKLFEKVTLSSPSIREAETRQGWRLNDGNWFVNLAKCTPPKIHMFSPKKGISSKKGSESSSSNHGIFRGYVSFRGEHPLVFPSKTDSWKGSK